MRILLALLLVATIGCTKKEETTPAEKIAPVDHSTHTMSDDSDGDEIAIPDDEMDMETDGDLVIDEPMEGGIIEENDECICTKDYRPVCGSNGVTYPNACQAGCESVTEFTEGACDAQ